MSNPTFSGPFQRLRVGVRRGLLIEALALLAGGLLVYLAITYPLDRWLRLEWLPRAVLLATAVALLVRGLIRRVLGPLAWRLPDDELALAVERCEPKLGQKLISSVQFERRLALASGQTVRGESPALMAAVVESLTTIAGGIPFRQALDRGRIQRLAAVAIGSSLLFLAAFAWSPANLRLWAARNLALSTTVEWPRLTRLAVPGGESGVIRLPQGDDLTIRAEASGVIPEVVEVVFRFAGGERGSELMAQTGEVVDGVAEFSYTFPTVIEPFHFHVEGGDGLTGRIAVELVPRPRVDDLRLLVHYPEYMQRASEELTTSVADPAGGERRVLPGDLRVVYGSTLAVEGRASKPLKEAYVIHGKNQRVPLTLADQQSLSGSFKPTETGLFAVELRDHDDLTTGQPPKVMLRVVEDQAPRVTWKPVGIGGMVTPMARIPGQLKVRDDFGLSALEAQIKLVKLEDLERAASSAAAPTAQAGGAPPAPPEPAWEPIETLGLERFRPTSEPFEVDPTITNLEASLNPDASVQLDAATNRAPPGTLLSIRFAAEDNFGPGEPHQGFSEVFTVRVVTPIELLNELVRRQEEQKREFELLLKQENADRAELRELPLLAADHADRSRIVARLAYLSRHQRSIGRRVSGVSKQYEQILAEMRNNRVGEVATIKRLEAEIVLRLDELVADRFPASADAVEDFRREASEDLRARALSMYDNIIVTMERVLKQMQGLETFIRVLEQLRTVIRDQDDAVQGARQLQKAAGEDIFNPKKDPEAPKPREDRDK